MVIGGQRINIKNYKCIWIKKKSLYLYKTYFLYICLYIILEYSNFSVPVTLTGTSLGQHRNMTVIWSVMSWSSFRHVTVLSQLCPSQCDKNGKITVVKFIDICKISIFYRYLRKHDEANMLVPNYFRKCNLTI